MTVSAPSPPSWWWSQRDRGRRRRRSTSAGAFPTFWGDGVETGLTGEPFEDPIAFGMTCHWFDVDTARD